MREKKQATKPIEKVGEEWFKIISRQDVYFIDYFIYDTFDKDHDATNK